MLRGYKTNRYYSYIDEKEAHLYKTGTKVRTHYNKGSYRMGANVQ